MTESPTQKQDTPGRTRKLRPAFRPPLWWPLPACALLGAACGLSYGLLAPKSYEATGYAMAVAATKTTDPTAALGYAQSYGRLATSDATLGYAQGAAGEPLRELRGRVRAETSPDSPMIAVTGTASRPRQAAEIADAVVEALIVSGGHVSKDTGVKLIRFTHAVAPGDPASPSVPLSAAVGGSAGGLVGGLLLLVRRRPEEHLVPAPVPGPAHEAEALAPQEREPAR
ncbi:lipopolysaccharide biosynthesis protein [Streptomyces sp. NBC_01218]|uniref:lipopolysaccharide biosynthesis protein n=1 Tax=Streptomyces sp. NBC_01218 TaxID=2903780 RepID=UPI002E152565|nr:lipopolysaccharide biosynthesis protein [Streptomyces sp. NBC_01218]